MELHAAAKQVERSMGLFVHVVKPGTSFSLSVCLMHVSPKFVYYLLCVAACVASSRSEKSGSYTTEGVRKRFHPKTGFEVVKR